MIYNGVIYSVHNCPYERINEIPIQPRRRGNPRTRRKFEYKDVLCAFDIETTGIHEIENSIMYVWQFAIDGIGVVMGRTWDDFLYFLGRLKAGLSADQRFLIFVHNLSYEFTFLKGIYHFERDEVFAVDKRKILKCEMLDSFEFRCSYLQSNMSLDMFCAAMGVDHPKLKGFDYSKYRWPDTPLSDFEIRYCVHDVIGLIEAMRARLRNGDDNFYTLPLTSTGYCRREAKQALRAVPRNVLEATFPNWEIYNILRQAFRGGNTHANRHYTGVLLHGVKSCDKSSHYPNVLLNRKYPMSRFYAVADPTLEDLNIQMNVRKRACLFEARFEGVRLRDPRSCGCPYIPVAKCSEISRDRVNDNGRVLSASYLTMTITDIDWKIIVSMYEWDSVEILKLYHARYGFLPKPFRELIKQHYTAKTALKNAPYKDEAERALIAEKYRHSKSLINALYGMLCQQIRPLLLYVEDDWIFDDSKSGPELLSDYYRRAFLGYGVGVWCTCWARFELQEMIDKCGRGFVYCDTDSVKYLGEIDWTEYNSHYIDQDRLTGGYAADPEGELHYMGVAEYEGEYLEFKTLGAKKYAVRNQRGVLEITIAGVSKSKGGQELENAGGLDAFKEGFTFHEAGGLQAVYNDRLTIEYYEREDGVRFPLTSNVYLKPSTYTLGLTEEYRRLVNLTYV